MSPIDELTFRLLQDALGDRHQATGLRNRWEQDSAGSDLAEFLVREQVFTEAAPKTIRLMQKGYIQIDGVSLLHPNWVSSSRSAPTVSINPRNSSQPPSRKSTPVTKSTPPRPATISHPSVPTTPIAESATEQLKNENLRRTSPQPEIPVISLSRSDSGIGRRADSGIGLGTRIGRCVLTRELGQGGGGAVYEAIHSGLGIRVAVKLLHASDEPSAREALRAEARLLAQLNHPNLVRVYDFDEECATPHLVMELVEGLSLADLIAQSGGLRPDRALEVISQTAQGLEAACRVGIIHRDVKPANVLLNKEGIAKVADLGLAVTSRERLSQETGARTVDKAGNGGTAAYMAPERFRGQGSGDFRSDIYSLGVTFFEAVTGQLPFTGSNAMELMIQHADAPIPDVSQIRPGIPSLFAATIRRMMAKNPNDRYLSYADLIADLVAISNSLKASSLRVEHPAPESLPSSTGSRLLSRLLQFRSKPLNHPSTN